MDNLAISDPTGDLFTNEKDLSPLTPELVQALHTEDVAIQIQATRQFRKLLSDTPNPLRNEIIKSGTVPRFVHFLEDTRHPELQLESAWLLIDIALGTSTQTQAVIDAGAIPVLIRLLSSPNEKIIELSVQSLGSIVFDATSRNLVLHSNVLPPLLGLFNNDTLSMSTVRTATLTLRILCWGPNPSLNFEHVSQCLPVFSSLIWSQDDDILVNVCWALSSLCDGPNEQIQAVIDSGVCPRAIQLLSHTANEVVLGALSLVGKIAMGTDNGQAQVLIKANALPALGRLLSHERASIVKDACRALSSITARNEKPIEAVIDPNISSLIGRLHHGDISVRQSAAWAIGNATASGSEEQIKGIVEAGAIAPLCRLLSETNSTSTKFALSGLVNILRSGESIASKTNSAVNPYATLLCNAPSMRLALYSENTAIALEATKRFGKLLGKPEALNLLIDEVIRSGAVPRFVHFLDNSHCPELQYESGWVLTNIASGNPAQTRLVIDAGAVSVLIRLLSFSDERVVEQSVWTLGNIAAASTEYRDLVLNNNVLPPLLGIFNGRNLSTSMMRTATWTLSSLCCGKYSPPNFAQVSPCLSLLARLMFNEDEEILLNVCQALSSLCDGPKEQIQGVIESGVCLRAVQLLSHTSNEIVSVALGLVCNISSGSESQLQVLLNANALPALGNLLVHEKESIVAKACSTLSNITSRNKQQIQALIDANLVPSLIELLHHQDIIIRKEVAMALVNATTNGSEQQIVYIVEAGAIAALCQLLTEVNSSLIKIALSCLENILRTGKSLAKATRSTVNPYATLVKQCDGFNNLVLLSFDCNKKTKKKLSNLLGML